MKMQSYRLREMKARLSKLIEMASRGKSFVMARTGKPMVKVIALDTPEPSRMKRFGFMSGQICMPDDFNTIGASEIQALFDGQA